MNAETIDTTIINIEERDSVLANYLRQCEREAIPDTLAAQRLGLHPTCTYTWRKGTAPSAETVHRMKRYLKKTRIG